MSALFEGEQDLLAELELVLLDDDLLVDRATPVLDRSRDVGAAVERVGDAVVVAVRRDREDGG